MWWPGTELNRRRQPFQGCALPPELPGHFLCRSTLNACEFWLRQIRRHCRSSRAVKMLKLVEHADYSNQAGFPQSDEPDFNLRSSTDSGMVTHFRANIIEWRSQHAS